MADNELRWTASPPEGLNRPVMVLALSGYFDTALVATRSIEHLVGQHAVETIATID